MNGDPVPERAEWIAYAACRGLPVELFVPSNSETEAVKASFYDRALNVCCGCPVANPCLWDALQARDFEAVRGGTIPRERRTAFKRADDDLAEAYQELKRYDGSPL